MNSVSVMGNVLKHVSTCFAVAGHEFIHGLGAKGGASFSTTRKEVTYIPYVLARHKVEDYARWKAAFDEGVAMRKAGGEKSYRIFQTVEDPNNLVFLFEWDTLDNARKFLESEELQAAMQQSGVVDQPDTYFLEEVEQGAG